MELDKAAAKAFLASCEEQIQGYLQQGWGENSIPVRSVRAAAAEMREKLNRLRWDDREREREVEAGEPRGVDFGELMQDSGEAPTPPAPEEMRQPELSTPFDDVNVVLSDDQQAAVDAIISQMRYAIEGAEGDPMDRIMALDGPAGTGKTTLVKVLARRALREGLVDSVAFVAPTGKAALRLRQKGCTGAGTIHAALYTTVLERGEDGEELEASPRGRRREMLSFKDPVAPCPPRCLLVCDEASMVPYGMWSRDGTARGVGETLEYMLPANSLLLYVGDTAQLPPVVEKTRGRANWVPALEFPTASLSTIHRQAEGNPIIQIATEVRLRQGSGHFPGEEDNRANLWTGQWASPQMAAKWLASRRGQGVDATLITWRNDTRRALNTMVRQLRGLDSEPVSAGDRLCIKKNNREVGLMNGEVIEAVRVLEIDPAPSAHKQGMINQWVRNSRDYPPMLQSHRRFKVWLSSDRSDYVIIIPGLMELSQGDFWRYVKAYRLFKDKNLVHCTYGECLTVHASQGSEWTHVGVVVDSAMAGHVGMSPQGPNLLYTAYTRAAEQLHVFWGA